MQQLLSQILSRDPILEVVGVASRPSQVEGLIASLKPDVLTMDIHMPEMDGVQLVKLLMPRHFIPTVMISSVSMAEGPMVLEALEAGAVDYIQKPEFSELDKVAPTIIEKVKNASRANMSHVKSHGERRSSRLPGVSSAFNAASSQLGFERIDCHWLVDRRNRSFASHTYCFTERDSADRDRTTLFQPCFRSRSQTV